MESAFALCSVLTLKIPAAGSGFSGTKLRAVASWLLALPDAGRFLS
jgi:hypothetical protein